LLSEKNKHVASRLSPDRIQAVNFFYQKKNQESNLIINHKTVMNGNTLFLELNMIIFFNHAVYRFIGF
jgi:hypothetical protein